MAEKQEVSKKLSKNKTSLPSIKQLLKEAWELFKKTIGAYLRLIGFGIAYILLLLLIGVLLALPVIFTTINSHFQLFGHLTPFSFISLGLLIVWGIFYIVSMVALSVVFPIVSIFILQGKKGKIIELIKQSKKYFWSYFLTVLLSGLLALGGSILFIIPGLLIAFFFAFVSFEVVFEGQSGWTALARSYFMIKNYFWEVLGRLLLLEIVVIIISSVLSRSANGDVLVRLVQILFSFFAAWYVRCYIFLLYSQVRDRITFPEKISIRWIWIVSVIGWVMFIFLLIGVGYVISHLPPAQPHTLHKIPQGAV